MYLSLLGFCPLEGVNIKSNDLTFKISISFAVISGLLSFRISFKKHFNGQDSIVSLPFPTLYLFVIFLCCNLVYELITISFVRITVNSLLCVIIE